MDLQTSGQNGPKDRHTDKWMDGKSDNWMNVTSGLMDGQMDIQYDQSF